MAVQKLTNNDMGAPTLNGQDGSLAAVLKWALPQLGWTLHWEHTDGFDVAFRNDSTVGTGHIIRFIDNGSKGQGGDGYFYDTINGSESSLYQDQRFCEVRCYKNFTGPELPDFSGESPPFQSEYPLMSSDEKYYHFGSISTNVNLCQSTACGHLVTKSYLEDTQAVDYQIIGDEQSFHLFTRSGESVHWSYFGDIISVVPNRPLIFVALTGNSYAPDSASQLNCFRQVYPESPALFYATYSSDTEGLFSLNGGLAVEGNMSGFEAVFIPSSPFGETYGPTLGNNPSADVFPSDERPTSLIFFDGTTDTVYTWRGSHPGIGRANRTISYSDEFQVSRIWIRGHRNPALNIGWLRGVFGGVGSWDTITYNQQSLTGIPTHLGDKTVTVYNTSPIFNEPYALVGKNSLWIDESSTSWE